MALGEALLFFSTPCQNMLMGHKRFLLLLSSSCLFSCAPSSFFYQKGEKPDETKDFLLYRYPSYPSEAADYDGLLPYISYKDAAVLLESGECLSILVSKDGCPSCEDLFATFRSISEELLIETWRMDPQNALALATIFTDGKSSLGKGTPGWYLIKKKQIEEVLYGSMENKEILRRKVINAFKEKASVYNGYRYSAWSSFWNDSHEGEELAIYIDRDDSSLAALYSDVVLPFLAKNTIDCYVLDVSFLNENDKIPAKRHFFVDGSVYPICQDGNKIPLNEAANYLNVLLAK